MVKHISCESIAVNAANVNANAKVQRAIQIKKGIMKHAKVTVKMIVHAKKIIVGILAQSIFESGKYLIIIADDSKIVCDESIYVMDIVSTNVTSTASINSDGKRIRYIIVLYSARCFMSDHITIHNRYSLLSL